MLHDVCNPILETVAYHISCPLVEDQLLGKLPCRATSRWTYSVDSSCEGQMRWRRHLVHRARGPTFFRGQLLAVEAAADPRLHVDKITDTLVQASSVKHKNQKCHCEFTLQRHAVVHVAKRSKSTTAKSESDLEVLDSEIASGLESSLKRDSAKECLHRRSRTAKNSQLLTTRQIAWTICE